MSHFLSGGTNVPGEELDLSDEEMKELAEWSQQEALRHKEEAEKDKHRDTTEPPGGIQGAKGLPQTP
jgi:hypothetical protein